MEQAKELRKYRRGLFDGAIKKDQKPDRVPLYSNQGNWAILDSGNTMSTTLGDYELLRKILYDFQSKYGYDNINALGTRNPLKVAEALELTGHIIDDEVGSVSIKDNKYMTEDDYPLISKKGWHNWLLQDYLPRKIVSKDAEDFERKLTAGMKETLVSFEYAAKMNQDLMSLGTLSGGKSFILQPACILMNWYRGIQNFSMDLRRKKNEVLEVLDVIWGETSAFADKTENKVEEINIAGAALMKTSIDVSDPEYTCSCDHWGSILSQSIMSPKQFETFIWPYLGKVMNYAADNDQTMILYAEADVIRFKDFINSIPKGHIAIALEMDNVFDAKRELGDHATILGGYPINYLYYKTIDECIDMCKKIMDEVAYDGSYIYSESKIVSHKTDAKSENLLAVMNYFRDQKYN